MEFLLIDFDCVVCEGFFIKDEFFSVLKGFWIGKLLGFDGFLIEFYFVFWDVLGDSFIFVFNECLSFGILFDI